jgi:hypothetical protein
MDLLSTVNLELSVALETNITVNKLDTNRQKWAGTEPTRGSQELCLNFDVSGFWYDCNCVDQGWLLNFLCERDVP